MNRFAMLLTGAALLAAQTIFAQLGSPDAPPAPGLPAVAGPLAAKYKTDADRILQAATNDNDGYAALTYLCDHVGKRLSGTPQLNTAVEWGAELMRKAGLQNVQVQPVMVPRWVRGSESGTIITSGTGPVNKPLHMLGLGMSVGRDYSTGGVSAELRGAGRDDFGTVEREDCGVQSGLAWIWSEYAVPDVWSVAGGGEGRGRDAGAIGDGAGDADSAYGHAGV